jgi:hypothetical protein
MIAGHCWWAPSGSSPDDPAAWTYLGTIDVDPKTLRFDRARIEDEVSDRLALTDPNHELELRPPGPPDD